MRAASLRHDFAVGGEAKKSAEQMDISGRYKVETESQDQIRDFWQLTKAAS
jgi:hypothetical protein